VWLHDGHVILLGGIVVKESDKHSNRNTEKGKGRKTEKVYGNTFKQERINVVIIIGESGIFVLRF